MSDSTSCLAPKDGTMATFPLWGRMAPHPNQRTKAAGWGFFYYRTGRAGRRCLRGGVRTRPVRGPHGAPPKPTDKSGWLVIFLSRSGKGGPLLPVGWYEDATFEDGYRERPEY